MNKKLLTKGSGYWDVTDYSYGNCFRRALKTIEVEVTGEKYPKMGEQFRFVLEGKTRTGWTNVLRSLENVV